MLSRRASGTLGSVALVLFGAGLGVGADRLILRHRVPSTSPMELHETALTYFQEEFGLDDDQLHAIDDVFRHHQQTVNASWEAVAPNLRSAIESVHARMAAILHPDQREAFSRWLVEQGEHDEHRIQAIEHTEDHDPPPR